MTTQDIVIAFRGWVYLGRQRAIDYENFVQWLSTDATRGQVEAVNRCGPMQFFNDFVCE